MSENYQERLRNIQAKFPNAYRVWTAEDENRLIFAFSNGSRIQELCCLLQRQPGAIHSRLRKLGITNIISTQGMTGIKPDLIDEHQSIEIPTNCSCVDDLSFNINLCLAWQPVLTDGISAYKFPEPITSYMKKHYKRPTIYRWKIVQPNSAYLTALYIGSTKCLCSDRINGYLNPKNSRTNQRLNYKLQQYLNDGYQVKLEILISGDKSIQSLNTVQVNRDGPRLFLEELII